MESRYSLRLYDTELMRFVMEKRGLAGLVAGRGLLKEGQAGPLPLGMVGRGGGVNCQV